MVRAEDSTSRAASMGRLGVETRLSEPVGQFLALISETACRLLFVPHKRGRDPCKRPLNKMLVELLRRHFTSFTKLHLCEVWT